MTQDEIIEMARQAEFVNLDLCSSELERFAKLVAAKAIAELESQEPVAWMDVDGNVSDNNDHKCFPIPLYTHPPQRTEKQNFCQRCGKRVGGIDSIHTCTPPQRTWVGLTDEEIKPCWYEACQTDLELTSQLVVYFAKAIEAKLKERNG